MLLTELTDGFRVLSGVLELQTPNWPGTAGLIQTPSMRKERVLLPLVGSQPIICFANSFASRLAAKLANQTGLVSP